jgi:hypothetical protein
MEGKINLEIGGKVTWPGARRANTRIRPHASSFLFIGWKSVGWPKAQLDSTLAEPYAAPKVQR